MTRASFTRARPLNDRILVVSVPVRFHRAGGRKQIVTPAGLPEWRPTPAHWRNSLIKAIVKAHHWRGLIETGQYASAAELARGENVNESYVCRVLRLTLLAPDIVEAILDGMQPRVLELKALLRPMPLDWASQRKLLGFPSVRQSDRNSDHPLCGHDRRDPTMTSKPTHGQFTDFPNDRLGRAAEAAFREWSRELSRKQQKRLKSGVIGKTSSKEKTAPRRISGGGSADCEISGRAARKEQYNNQT